MAIFSRQSHSLTCIRQFSWNKTEIFAILFYFICRSAVLYAAAAVVCLYVTKATEKWPISISRYVIVSHQQSLAALGVRVISFLFFSFLFFFFFFDFFDFFFVFFYIFFFLFFLFVTTHVPACTHSQDTVKRCLLSISYQHLSLISNT